jgi:hypothetical protein
MSSNARPSRHFGSWPGVIALAMLCILIASSPMWAQTTVASGSIVGSVSDPSGAVVGGAKVTITNKATGSASTATTTSAGGFSSGALTPGEYSVKVEAKGFRTSEISLTVQVGVTSPANLKLQLGSGTEVVEVQASQVQINSEQATVQGVLNTEQIENLPINGRNFLDLAQLEPGVQIQDGGNFDPTKNGFSSISFGGRFGRTARIEVDGIDISDETVGTTTQNVPAGAIQEFQLGQSMLDLSTELTSSGSVNVVTRSGTNQYHGEGFYYFRDQTLDANLPGAANNPFQRNQYGASLGGPLIKNKLFFFADGERNKQDLIDPVLPGGTFTGLAGNFNSPFRESQVIGRLDYQISDNYKAFYRFSYDHNSSVLPFVPNSFQPFKNLTNTPVHAVGLDFNTGSYTHSIRFGYTKFRNGIVDATAGSSIFNPAPQLELAIGEDPNCLNPGRDVFCSGPNFLAPQATIQSDHQLKYDGSKAKGSHVIRYGVGYNHIQGGGFAKFLGLAPAVNAVATACCTGATPFAGGAANPLNFPAQNVTLGNGQGFPSEKKAFGFPAGGLGPDNRFSWYIGDSWKIKPNFTLTAGLRYARDTGRTDSDVAPIAALNAFGPGLGDRVNQPNHNFAPQLGFAWDPSSRGRTVIRGGIGLFYENSIWNNNLFDRPARLPQGLFLSTIPACLGGQPQSLPFSTSINLAQVCGQPIGSVATQIAALEQQFQAATVAAGPAVNPVFIGNILADGINATGTNLFAPNYITPRSVQMNIGIQREIRDGMVLSVDYLRNVATHNLLTVDTNHVGDARFLNTSAAQAAIAGTIANCGAPLAPNGITICPSSPVTLPAGSAPYVPRALTIADFATNGLDSGDSLCGGVPCPNAAFAGVNPNLGTNQMLFPVGRSVYNGLQASLKQNLRSPVRGIKYLNLQVSYAFSRYVSTARDNDFINFAEDNNNPTGSIGPNALDRTHQLSFGGTMDLPLHFRVSVISHFYSPLPQNLRLPVSGNPGGIFVTDVTGDGTGDGSGNVSNGGLGDLVPGTKLGAFGRSTSVSGLSNLINNYNANFAGQPTPAGQTLISNGLFTLAQLQGLGGVQQALAPVPAGEVGQDWLRAFDFKLAWPYAIKERYKIEPGISFYNVFNFANFNGPNTIMNAALDGTIGSPNGTPNKQPDFNRLGLGSGVFGLGSPRVIEFTLKFTF